MLKGSIQEDVTLVNTHVSNIRAPQYIRQMLTAINGEIDDSTIIAGTLTPYLLQWTDHPDGKSINKQKP